MTRQSGQGEGMEKIKKEPSREKENLVFPFPRTYKKERKKEQKRRKPQWGGQGQGHCWRAACPVVDHTGNQRQTKASLGHPRDDVTRGVIVRVAG